MKFLFIPKDFFLLIAILLISSVYCAAQSTSTQDKIAILPFNGGSLDERDGIAELFSYTPQLMKTFNVIPRTTITKAIETEKSFQNSSGMTDADTMARLGNQIGADFVLAGSITSVGKSNLLIVSIVKIDVIQQVAGDFLIYKTLDVLNKDKSIINKMAENLVSIITKNNENMDKLAVLPVQFSDGVNEQDGDALAQLLSIFLIRNGKYAVYPRTKTLEQVQDEYSTQMSGITRDTEVVTLGRGINPPYVLSIASRKIGSGNRFNASVINLEIGNQIAGYTETYSTLTDGINAIDLLAKQLSGIEVSEKERNKRVAAVSNNTTNEQRQIAADKFLKSSGFNLAGFIGFNEEATIPGKVAGRSFTGGAELELRLSKYFGLQTGLNIFQKTNTISTIPATIKRTAIQMPILARANIAFGLFCFSPYIGIGLNLASIAPENDDLKIKSFSKLNFLAGAEFGLKIRYFSLFMGFQYNRDLSDDVFLAMGNDYLARNHSSIWYFGIGWFIPFRKESDPSPIFELPY